MKKKNNKIIIRLRTPDPALYTFSLNLLYPLAKVLKDKEMGNEDKK